MPPGWRQPRTPPLYSKDSSLSSYETPCQVVLPAEARDAARTALGHRSHSAAVLSLGRQLGQAAEEAESGRIGDRVDVRHRTTVDDLPDGEFGDLAADRPRNVRD